MKYKLLILLIVTCLMLLSGCRETSENQEYYYSGIRAEHQMKYSQAIEHYAKALTYNRQDAVTWNAKGRCHLLLAMQSYFLEQESNVREVRIKGNLSKAQDCFRRALQWGYTPSADIDSLKVHLDNFFVAPPQR